VFKRIHATAISVSDQDVALDFYVNTLGWEKRLDNSMGPDERFLTVAPNGAETELILGGASMYPPEDGKGIPNGITLIVDDVDATYAELSAKNVKFSMPPADMPWGARGAHFEDPDGNSFFVTAM
jgi:catechol 2,3-dioxygenase-like lactoylglutathione lyase family enzyme